MHAGLSIRTRAVLAIVLLVGFYTLALGVVAGLLYIPYAEWVYVHRVDVKPLLFCVVGAFLILKAIVPRPDRFEAPGPRLTPDAQPRLFELIDGVAHASGQATPSEVYLVPDVNAFVTQRGGVMGIGSRRVMGIGLPLLELLTIGELRAVIAHEFGHYVSGDTSLGPWIYKTRAALGRTLHEVAGHSRWLAKPFEWYAAGFLRITYAVSRAQEFVADATGAAVAGHETMKRALVRVAGGSAAFDGYWHSELAPALGRGFRPPIVAGFRQFLAAPSVSPRVAELVDRQLADSSSDPFDTHPNLRDRLATLDRGMGTQPARAASADEDAPAITLLDDVDAAESALLAPLLRGGTLSPIDWETVPTTVLPVGWRETVHQAAPVLAALTPERVPELAADFTALAVRLRIVRTPSMVEDEHRQRATAVIGSALALALLDRTALGDPPALRLEAPPGEPVRFVLGETEVLPFSVCEQLAEGTLDPATWASVCERTGIAGVDLAGAGVRSV